MLALVRFVSLFLFLHLAYHMQSCTHLFQQLLHYHTISQNCQLGKLKQTSLQKLYQLTTVLDIKLILQSFLFRFQCKPIWNKLKNCIQRQMCFFRKCPPFRLNSKEHQTIFFLSRLPDLYKKTENYQMDKICRVCCILDTPSDYHLEHNVHTKMQAIKFNYE